jgi:hypothetical protein
MYVCMYFLQSTNLVKQTFELRQEHMIELKYTSNIFLPVLALVTIYRTVQREREVLSMNIYIYIERESSLFYF